MRLFLRFLTSVVSVAILCQDLIVIEVKNSRSEFWLEIKILLYKSTPGNTKMALEFDLDTKYNICISESNRFSGIDQSVWNFTNKNVLFRVQFKFYCHFRVPRGRFV